VGEAIRSYNARPGSATVTDGTHEPAQSELARQPGDLEDAAAAGHVNGMIKIRTEFRGPQLDMTPDGQFRDPPAPPLASRVGAMALLLAVITGAAVLAALALWFALALIPLALAAAVVAWAAFRFQVWRARRGAPPASFSSQRDLFRRR
jgi:hypothetical protein